nr:hypothetical protein BaRGS_005643 [Batillaria attramentaria]
MACVRRRIKRGMILVLACYATFLLLSVHSWFDGSLSQSATDTENGAQVKVQQVSVIKKDVQPDLDQNEVIEDGDVPGGSEKRHPNSVLLPEELDMAIQQQPVGRAVRKKLSQPHPQQLNVVVEDAPPGTFVKRYYPPESDSGFRDLDPVAAAPASSNRRFQELRFLGEREIGLKSGNQEEGEEQVNSLQPGRGQGDSEEDRVAVAHKDKHQELIQKTNNKRGAWISPDGSPDDLNAGRQSVEPVQVVFHQTADCKRMKKHCFYVLSCQTGAHLIQNRTVWRFKDST